MPCFRVTVISVPVPSMFYFFRNRIFQNEIYSFIALVLISVVSVIITIWIVGLDKDIRIKLTNLAKEKLRLILR